MTSAIEQQIENSAQQLAERLLADEILLATAESCTGGGIAAALTALPGSSRWFDCGFVTYSNEAKSHLLNVPEALFELCGPGAVSEETALAMAKGAVANSRAQLAVAVTGVAGPDGGTPEKPVGTVWIAWHWQGHGTVQCFRFAGDRAAVRLATQAAALEGLLKVLSAAA
jgi:nicotinamide-nucleotide amidase